MLNPITELRAFLRASLLNPVGEPMPEAPPALRRRRWIAVATLVLGGATPVSYTHLDVYKRQA